MGNAWGICWKYSRTLLGMQGKCIGNTLEIFEEFIRNAREMHGEYIGNIRGLY